MRNTVAIACAASFPAICNHLIGQRYPRSDGLRPGIGPIPEGGYAAAPVLLGLLVVRLQPVIDFTQEPGSVRESFPPTTVGSRRIVEPIEVTVSQHFLGLFPDLYSQFDFRSRDGNRVKG